MTFNYLGTQLQKNAFNPFFLEKKVLTAPFSPSISFLPQPLSPTFLFNLFPIFYHFSLYSSLCLSVCLIYLFTQPTPHNLSPFTIYLFLLEKKNKTPLVFLLSFLFFFWSFFSNLFWSFFILRFLFEKKIP